MDRIIHTYVVASDEANFKGIEFPNKKLPAQPASVPAPDLLDFRLSRVCSLQ